MSWRDNAKPSRGYFRYGGSRGGGNFGHNSSENEHGGGDREQQYGGFRGRGGNRGRPYKRHGQHNNSYDNKRTKHKVGQRLKEEDVGVTEFVGSHKRLGGILKERFSDFHVNEISCDGRVCKLTNQDIPPEPEDLEDLNQLEECIPVELREQLVEFSRSDNEKSMIEIDVTELNKQVRRNIHVIAKKIPSVVSETVQREEKKIIVLAKKGKETSHNFRGDERVDWSSRGGDYCDFLLHKVNMDTMDALNQLAIRLRIKSSLFHYAGTKDRRAHTTQWVNLRKCSPWVIYDAARYLRGVYVGNFKFSKNPLTLGMLKGNRFKIALRSVTGTNEEIELAMQSLKKNGFINYYGLQRFGTIAVIPTHHIGKTLLQGKWKEAIELILKPRECEQQREMIEAREIYKKTKDAKLALRPIARSGKIEAKILYGLTKCDENNPQGALDFIPRNARLMYIHAYQSFVWNHIVSRRIKEFGSKPIVGDLVYDEPNSKHISDTETMDYAALNNQAKESKTIESEAIEEQTISTEAKKSVEDEQGVDENATKTDIDDEKTDDAQDTSLPRVKALTEEDLHRYTLADVVMSKPGWKVTYPSYAKPWFDEFLAKDDLTTDLRQKNKKYSLGGGYRKILETADDLSWKIVRYMRYHDNLIPSDIDEMRGVEPSVFEEGKESFMRNILELIDSFRDTSCTDSPREENQRFHKALIVEFSLNSSTYATMALREILENDTSAQAQALQSAANQAQEALDKGEKMETNDQSMETGAATVEDENSSRNVEDDKSNEIVADQAEKQEAETEIQQEISPQKNPESEGSGEMEIANEDVKMP